MKPVLTLTTLVLAIAFASAALRGDGIIEQKFKEFDKNGDGVLSGDELDAAPWLRKLDLNGDGKVTLDEAREAMAKFGKQMFSKLHDKVADMRGASYGPRTEDVFHQLDKNGDGKLTPDELTNKEYFAKLDVNHDGVVTLEEAISVLGERIPQRYVPQPDAPPIKEPVEIQEGPRIMSAGAAGVGCIMPKMALKTADGSPVKLPTRGEAKALVVGCFSTSCPLSQKLAPEMARLENDYRDKGVSFVWLAAVPGEPPDNVKKFAADHALRSPVAWDKEGSAAAALGATATTEVFVFDAAGTLSYRGAINDQYGLGYALDAPRHTYMREALDSLLRGETPVIAATSAPGCALDLPKSAPGVVSNAGATYNREIARIMNANCVECHRDGGLGPFALTAYADLVEHAPMIRKQITRGAMPPWFASRDESGAHALFSNDRSLSEADKATLLAWLDSGRAQGEVADAPLPRKFPEGWSIGEPDLVLQLPRPIAIKAEGVMPYQNVTVPVNLGEDRWVQSYEIIPTDRRVVHHVIVRIVGSDGKISRENGRNEAEGLWAAYVPGNSTRVLPEGYAKKLPAGSSLHFQMHYTPNGTATQDQLKIGLRFAKKPPQYEVRVTGLANVRLNIPPNEANHVETLSRVLPVDMLVSGFMPHMHVRGKSFKYEVNTPDGKTETLLDVPAYDFNWQLQYRLAQPRVLPRGSTMKITAVFDNSSGNRANPDPNRRVRWGEQTTDEMMIGYVEHFVPLARPSVATK